MTAGGDLPDLMFISIVPALPNVPAFLKQSCASLTQYLSGDAIKAFPNLANIPSAPWRVVVQNGGISRVLRPCILRSAIGSWLCGVPAPIRVWGRARLDKSHGGGSRRRRVWGGRRRALDTASRRRGIL